MDDKDKKAFLQDFRDANIEKKLDMWYFALDQEALWEELLDEMSKFSRIRQLQEMKEKTKWIKMYGDSGIIKGFACPCGGAIQFYEYDEVTCPNCGKEYETSSEDKLPTFKGTYYCYHCGTIQGIRD